MQSKTEITAVILTSGTSQQQIDALIVEENTTLFILSSSFYWQKSLDLSKVKNNLIMIENPSDIFLYKPLFHQLNLYGDGLNSAQWKSLQLLNSLDRNASKKRQDDKQRIANISFYPSQTRTGLTDLKWPKQIILGQPFHVNGKFITAVEDENRIFKVILSDLHDETVDELIVKHNDLFNLSTSVRNQGLFTYQLKVFNDENELVITEPVAFTVSSSGNIKVAIKQSSPSFESNHLKNWLAEQGEEVFVITQVSQDKYIQQTVNRFPIKNLPDDDVDVGLVNRALSNTWLDDFDLLYMDGRALLSISDEEMIELNSAVKKGLGLVVILDEELISSAGKISTNALFENTSITFNQETIGERKLNTIPSWPHSQDKLSLAYNRVKLSSIKKTTTLIEGSEGQPLWLNQHYGLGKVAISLIDTSYQWSISGAKTHYSRYWQYIIEQVARHKQNSGWQKSPFDKIYFQGQAQQLCAQLSISDIDNVKIKQVNLMMSAVVASKYCGNYWANTTGWHEFILENGKGADNQTAIDIQNVFLYQQSNWLTWQQALKNKASYLAQLESSKTVLDFVYVPLDKLNMWWLLFISLSLLWYERKTF
jgi:hypothetical protein